MITDLEIGVSIDPGKNGAVVVRVGSSIPRIFDMVYDGKHLDLRWIDILIKDIKPAYAVVEDVHTSPRSGVVSAGNFMYAIGAIHATVISNGVMLSKLSPQLWKNSVGLYGKEKKEALTKYVEVYGQASFDMLIKPFKNKVDRAEAALIGHAFHTLRKYNKL